MIPSKLIIVHGSNMALYKNNQELPIIEAEINPVIQSSFLNIEKDIIQTNNLSEVIDILISDPEYYDAMIINVDYEINCDAISRTIELLNIRCVEINTRVNKEKSSINRVSELELIGELSAKIYKTALFYLADVGLR